MSGEVALVDSGDGAISRLVRTASTLFASPGFRPTALVGGLRTAAQQRIEVDRIHVDVMPM